MVGRVVIYREWAIGEESSWFAKPNVCNSIGVGTQPFRLMKEMKMAELTEDFLSVFDGEKLINDLETKEAVKEYYA